MIRILLLPTKDYRCHLVGWTRDWKHSAQFV